MDKKKILLVSIGHLSCDINGGALPASLPYLRAAHGLDYQATASLMLAYSCLSSIIQPVLGLLADKHQKPWFIPLGVALAGCGLAIMGFMENYWAIFAGIAISGIGSAFFHPEGARFANKASGANKGVGLSIFSIGGNSGFILGPLIVTAFAGTLGLHGMAVFAVIGIVMAIILARRIASLPPMPPAYAGLRTRQAERPDHAPRQAADADEMTEKNGSSPNCKNNWKEFSKLTVVIVSRAIVFTGCNTFIPLYWVNALGQSKASSAMALAIFGACGVACNILGGMLSDRIGYIKVIRIAFMFMAPIVLALALASNMLMAYALLPFLSCALYLPFSAQVVLGQKLLAQNIGFASGVTLGLGTTLGGVMQPCLGWLADNYGLSNVFICLACFGLLGATFAWVLSGKAAEAA